MDEAKRIKYFSRCHHGYEIKTSGGWKETTADNEVFTLYCIIAKNANQESPAQNSIIGGEGEK